jgi:hypothetical protein
MMLRRFRGNHHTSTWWVKDVCTTVLHCWKNSGNEESGQAQLCLFILAINSDQSIMTKFHDFLLEHARFPFPLPDELRTADTTDVSDFEAVLLESVWKAKHAVGDDAPARKLCDSLQNILGDTALSADSEKVLLAKFSPRLGTDGYGEDEEWLTNPSKVQASFQNIPCNRHRFTVRLIRKTRLKEAAPRLTTYC